MKVGILGLGLIGGSLAKDLAAEGVTVLGYDRDDATIRAARRARVIVGRIGRDFGELASCDACVIAVSVSAAPSLLRQAAAALASVPLTMDVGSTKESIVVAAQRCGLGTTFVGAHPFAGDHKSGWRAARAGLFAGARVMLTPARTTSSGALRRARAFWRRVGARPELMGARAHDAFMAAASHLPQLFATALAGELAAAGVPRDELGRGGQDATRLAGSNPDVWTAIALDNREQIAPRLREGSRRLAVLARAVSRGDGRAIRRAIDTANRWFAG